MTINEPFRALHAPQCDLSLPLALSSTPAGLRGLPIFVFPSQYMQSQYINAVLTMSSVVTSWTTQCPELSTMNSSLPVSLLLPTWINQLGTRCLNSLMPANSAALSTGSKKRRAQAAIETPRFTACCQGGKVMPPGFPPEPPPEPLLSLFTKPNHERKSLRPASLLILSLPTFP